MSNSSNVRNIDSLVALHAGMIRLSSDWDKTLQEVRTIVFRAEEYFSQTQPQYWRHQTQLAEREFTEARDSLTRKRATVRVEDRPAATEERVRLAKAERRLRDCQEKLRTIRTVVAAVNKVCEDLRGPLADVTEHCETILPQAARELATLIEQLKKYAEQQGEMGG